jgi:hypothetical protein
MANRMKAMDAGPAQRSEIVWRNVWELGSLIFQPPIARDSFDQVILIFIFHHNQLTR